jgi:hypothetical protein
MTTVSHLHIHNNTKTVKILNVLNLTVSPSESSSRLGKTVWNKCDGLVQQTLYTSKLTDVLSDKERIKFLTCRVSL